MHPRYTGHAAKEANFNLVTGCLHFKIFRGTDLGKHGRLLPLDPPIFTFKFLAPLARWIGRAIRPLLRLDALCLAAAQVDSYLVIDGAALRWLQLGQ